MKHNMLKKKPLRTVGILGVLLLLPPAVWLASGSEPPEPPPLPELPSVPAVSTAPAPPAPPAVPAVLAVPAPPEPPPAPEHRDRHGRRVWLGVFLSDEDGVSIIGVREDSPAEKAGLKKGDRILEIDGHEVDSARDLRRAMRDLEPGDDVQIRIERKGDQQTLTATLEEWPHEMHYDFHFSPGGEDWEKYLPHMFWSEGSRNYLGVQIQTMTEDLRGYFHAPEGVGLLISKVVEDTPAERAGLQAGDVLIEIDGQEIHDRGDIRKALAPHEPGDVITVRIVRDKSERTLDVEVGERPGRRSEYRLFDCEPDCDLHFEGTGFTGEICDEIRESLKDALEGLEDSEWDCEGMQQRLHDVKSQLAFSREQREALKAQVQEAMQLAREGLAASMAEREEMQLQVQEAMEHAREAMKRAREVMERARENEAEL